MRDVKKNHLEGGAEEKETEYIKEKLRNMKNRMRSSNMCLVNSSGEKSRENGRSSIQKDDVEHFPRHES